MSRLKIGLGLSVIVVTAVLIGVATWPHQSRSSQRTIMEPTVASDSVGERPKKAAAKLSESDGVLKSLGGLSSESDPAGSNAPRMQTKQIKMH